MYRRKVFIVQGRKYRMQHGNGRAGRWLKRLGQRLFTSGKKIARDSAPLLASVAGNRLLQEASKRGLSDDLVNIGSRINQKAAHEVAKATKQKSKLSGLEQASSDLIQKRLANLLAGQGVRMGNGTRGFGSGVRGLGTRGFGVRRVGGGLENVDA